MPASCVKTCNKCHAAKPITEFCQRKRDKKSGCKGMLTNRCGSCMDQDAQAKALARKRKLLISEDSADLCSDATQCIQLTDHLDHVSAAIQVGAFKHVTQVDCSLHVQSEKPAAVRAWEVTSILGNHMQLHWTCITEIWSCTNLVLICAPTASRKHFLTSAHLTQSLCSVALNPKTVNTF